MLVDHGTIGGYLKIATVISADLDKSRSAPVFLLLCSACSHALAGQGRIQPRTTTKWLPSNPFHPNEACLGGILPVPPSTKLRDQNNSVVRTSEMNEAEANTLVEMFTKPGETVFDGSAGTCTIVTACLRLGRKMAVADPDTAAIELGITRCKQFLNWFVARDLIPLGNKPLPEPREALL